LHASSITQVKKIQTKELCYKDAQLNFLSPSRRREAPCEGTNSPRLFTPGETKALAKSKGHQSSRALTNDLEWVVILTDLKKYG
jgi:hypothetical protein